MGGRLTISCGELRRLYLEEGLGLATLAARLGCSAPTVGRRLRECGIRTRSGRFRACEVSPEVLARLYLEERLALRVIAERLGVSVSTVNSRRRAFGLPARRGGRPAVRAAADPAEEGAA